MRCLQHLQQHKSSFSQNYFKCLIQMDDLNKICVASLHFYRAVVEAKVPQFAIDLFKIKIVKVDSLETLYNVN